MESTAGLTVLRTVFTKISNFNFCQSHFELYIVKIAELKMIPEDLTVYYARE